MGPADTAHLLRGTERGRRVRLGVLVLAWGIQAIVTQSLLLREALVLMFGSEFAWGIVLFAWLLGVAGGGVFGGWLAERVWRADIALVAVLLMLSVAACVELWIFRGARAWLGVEPGELLPLPKTAVAAVLFVSPASALVGVAFPLACCITSSNEPRGLVRAEAPRGLKPAARGVLQLGNVYTLESAGSLIGGAAFSFWAVEHLSPIQTALSCGAITAAASAGFLAIAEAPGGLTLDASRKGEQPVAHESAPRGLKPAARESARPRLKLAARRSYWSICLALLAVAALMTSALAGDALNRRLVDRRWQNVAPGYELCAEAESKYQNLAVGRRAEQFTLYCDGQVSADFPDPYAFAPLAHFRLCQHPRPRQVLVLGGGAEGLVAEILRHPVEHVDYIEPDSRQIELIEPYLAEIDRRALNDQRVTVHYVDVRYYVKTQANRFDLVLARLPEPMSSLRARLYTDEFYGELRRAMTPRSVLCMTAAATPGSLTAASAEYLGSIRATLQRHFPHITIGWGNPAQVLAATEAGLLSIDPAELANRYSQRGVESEFFRPGWFDGATDWLDPDKLQKRAKELGAAHNVEVSTDLHPVVYMQRLVLWERMTGGREGRVIERLRSIHWSELVATLLAIAGVTFLACYVRARLRGSRRPTGMSGHGDPTYSWFSDSAIILSVGTTGFATMALSIVWLFAFQNLYGYVYQRIGWIIAVFMGGLVIGCELVNRRSKCLAGADSSLSQNLCGTGFPAGKKHQESSLRTGSKLPTFLWRWLILVDVLLALLALAVPFVLPALGELQTGPVALTLVEWCVSIMVALTGVLGGAAFPLAGGLQLKATGRAGAAAGTIVGADHAGACLGALLCGILLVPVFGTAVAAFLLAGVKLTSAGLLLLGRRFLAPLERDEEGQASPTFLW